MLVALLVTLPQFHYQDENKGIYLLASNVVGPVVLQTRKLCFKHLT